MSASLKRLKKANATLTAPLPGINLQGHPARGADLLRSLFGLTLKDSIGKKGHVHLQSFTSGIRLIPRPDGGSDRLIVGAWL